MKKLIGGVVLASFALTGVAFAQQQGRAAVQGTGVVSPGIAVATAAIAAAIAAAASRGSNDSVPATATK